MAITALVKSSTLIVYPGEDKTKARNIEVSGAPTFADSFDTIERDVVRQSFSTYAPIRGLETTSGTITVELHGSGTEVKPPESSMLYKGAFGSLVGPFIPGTPNEWAPVDDTLIATIVSISPPDPVTWNDGSNDIPFDTALFTHNVEISVSGGTTHELGFKKQMPVRITVTGTLHLVGFISELTDNIIVIISENGADLSGLTGAEVDCGWLFMLKHVDGSQVLALTEYTADYFRGDITKENWQKNLSTEFSIDFQTGQVVLPSFNFEGGGVGYGNETPTDVPYDEGMYSNINTDFDSSTTSPLIVQLTDIYLEKKNSQTLDDPSSRFFQECVSGIQITLTNEVYKKQCMASIGVGEVIRTSRACTGSLETFYTSKDFQQAFKDDELYICRMAFNYATNLDASGAKEFTDTPGNVVCVSIPQLKFSEVSIEEDTGIFKYSNSFACEPVEGDDELYFAFM